MDNAHSRPVRRLTIGFATAGLVLLVTGSALAVLNPALDQYLFDRWRSAASSGFIPLATALSTIGGIAWLGPLALAIVLWLIWQQRRAEALWLFLTIGSGRLTVEALKLSFEKARPPLADHLAVVTSYSFPSSHSAGSMLTAAAIAMLLLNRSRALMALVLASACAVGWSRIALAVHWPSDVLAGLGLGMLWVAIAARWLPAARTTV